MKTYTFVILSALALLLYSCKNSNKSTAKVNKQGQTYTVQSGKSSVNWTAYKKSTKAPVHGTFKPSGTDAPSFVKKSSPAATAIGAADGLEFSIPVMEIFSGNEQRDNILRTFFFGLMKNTVQLQGTVHVDSAGTSTGTVDISMNGEQHSIPVTFTVNNDTLSLKGHMNLDDWHVSAAMESLNKHCKLQHTGADGKSITWSDVDLNVNTVLSVK